MKFSYNNMKNIVSISNHACKNIMKFFVTISILEILKFVTRELCISLILIIIY
jgi:hypothetical protein